MTTRRQPRLLQEGYLLLIGEAMKSTVPTNPLITAAVIPSTNILTDRFSTIFSGSAHTLVKRSGFLFFQFGTYIRKQGAVKKQYPSDYLLAVFFIGPKFQKSNEAKKSCKN